MDAPDDLAPRRGVLAIDVGNSRVKLGWFPAGGECPSGNPATAGGLAIARPTLPLPAATAGVRHRGRPASEWLDEIRRWCDDAIDAPAWRAFVASVHPDAADALAATMASAGNAIQTVTGTELPVQIKVERPERVGIDRLLNAVAARALAPPGATIVVDVGTAITVDLVEASGAFAGGAILPGPATAAAALHAATAALPDLSPEVWDEPPSPVGVSTEGAIAAGVYWGVVGSVRELVHQIAGEHGNVASVFLTGGAGLVFAHQLKQDSPPLRYVEHLTLAGLNLAAAQLDP